MIAFTKEQREFIVLRLARFETPAEIVAAFLNEWRDTHCDEAAVMALDPGRGAIHAPELIKEFQNTRERILTDPAAAPAADKRVRLIILQRMADKARGNNQIDLAARLLAQIAVESDGVAGAGAGGLGGPPGDATDRRITRRIVDPAEPVPAE